MRTDRRDVMAELAAADPVSRTGLDRTPEVAFTAMREGITMTARDTTTAGAGRRTRRRVAASGLALALVGGGTAYAAYDRWYSGGSLGGLTCLTEWADPGTASGEQLGTGGPWISTDPVADCQRYQTLSGEPPIADPVAFTWQDWTIVAPRAQVPDDAELFRPPTRDDLVLAELSHSLEDIVDGGGSRCFDTASGPEFARGEVARLGLTHVRVIEQQVSQTEQEGECGWFVLTEGEPGETPTVLFSPKRTGEPGEWGPDLDPLVAALRSQVAEGCVSLSEAERITDAALARDSHHWPTSATLDEGATCTSVDVVTGGSVQVFLRGPATTR